VIQEEISPSQVGQEGLDQKLIRGYTGGSLNRFSLRKIERRVRANFRVQGDGEVYVSGL